jgi:hypothetical protein
VGSRAGLDDLVKSGVSRLYRDSNTGSFNGYLVAMPNTAQLLHPTPLSLAFLGRPSINPLSQSTACHLLEKVDTRNLTSHNRKSLISVHIATGVTWLITWGGGKEGGHVDTGYCSASIQCPVKRGFSYFCLYTTKIIVSKIFLQFLLAHLILSSQKQKLLSDKKKYCKAVCPPLPPHPKKYAYAHLR